MLLCTIVTLTLIPYGVSMVAYNCAGEHTAMSRVSAVDIGDCVSRRKKDVATSQQEVQIIQINDDIPVQLRQCFAEEQIVAYHCGMHSHSAMLPHISTFSAVPLPISISDCKKMQEEGIWNRGRTTHKMVQGGNIVRDYLAGESWGDGQCVGGRYTFSGNQYKDVVVASEIKVYLQEKVGSIKKGKIVIDNILCELQQDYCQDDEFGTVYWDLSMKECMATVSVLYSGPSWLLKSNGSPTLQFINSTSMTLYIEQKGNSVLCGRAVSKTSHNSLYIAPKILSSYQFPLLSAGVVPDNTLLLQTRLYTLSLYLSNNLNLIYDTLTKQICEANRSNMLTKIMTLPQMVVSPWEKGTYAKKMGEVVYLFSCTPVIVSIGRPTKCTLEMPVIHMNKTLYMEPITKLLVSVPTEVECDGGTPPVYRTDNHWVEIGKKLRESNTPNQLSPAGGVDLDLTPLHTGKSGIYNDEDLEQFNQALFFQRNREARLSQWATDSIHSGEQGILSAIDPLDFQTWLSDKLSGVFGWWFWFGSIWAAVSATIFLFSLIMSCVGAALSAKQVHKMYGCTKVLFCAFWEPILQVLLKNKQPTPKVSPYTEAQAMLNSPA